MENLLVLIREPIDSGASAESIAGAICPYIETFGAAAKVVSVRRCHELRAGQRAARVALLDVEVSDGARVELAELAAKLARFFKQTARDADLDVTFEVLHFIPPLEASANA
jgi:hypothetical protein